MRTKRVEAFPVTSVESPDDSGARSMYAIDGEWFFRDETESAALGPFSSKSIVVAAYRAYASEGK